MAVVYKIERTYRNSNESNNDSKASQKIISVKRKDLFMNMIQDGSIYSYFLSRGPGF